MRSSSFNKDNGKIGLLVDENNVEQPYSNNYDFARPQKNQGG